MSAVAQLRGEEPSRAGADARTRTFSKRALILAVIAVELVLLYVLFDREGWVYDDNLILILAGKSGLTWSWLNSLIFEHWGFGYHFVFSVLHKLMPIDYRWALAVLLAFLGGSIYLLERIMSLLFGWGWRSVLVAAWLGLSVLFIKPLEWWALGLQLLPAAFFELLCAYGFVRYQIDGARRWIAVAAGGLAGALLFYEKPAYMLLYLALIRILLLSADLHPRALLRTFWRERMMWGALIVVTGVWAIAFHLNGGGAGGSGTVTASQYLTYFKNLWVDAFVPAAFGASLPPSGLDTGQIVLAIVLQLAAVGAIVFAAARNRHAWRAWLLLAITLLFTGVLVARARVAQFGVGVGADQRYLLDFCWLLPISVAFAFSGRRVLEPRAGEQAVSISRGRWSRSAAVAGIAAGVLTLGYAAIAVSSATMLRDQWPGQQGRAWEARLMTSLHKLEQGGRHVVLADDTAPFIIVPPAFAPYNLLSWVVPLYDRKVQVDGVLSGPLVALDQNGTARPARLVAPDDGAVSALMPSRKLSITGAAQIVRRPSDVCVTPGPNGATLLRQVSAATSSPTASRYVLMSYDARRSSTLPVVVQGSGAPTASQPLEVAAGPARSIVFLGASAVRRLAIRIDGPNTICVSRIDVGTLAPIS